MTHLPGTGSAALDAGVAAGHAFDQRGDPRTVDQPTTANGPGSDGTDIGAVELATLPVAALPPKKFDLKAAIAKCKKKFPKGKKRKSCIKKAKAKAKT